MENNIITIVNDELITHISSIEEKNIIDEVKDISNVKININDLKDNLKDEVKD